MNASAIKHPSAFVPIVMSVAAMTTVVCHIVLVGTAPQPDEGTAAHIWQLLMAGQIPVILFHAVKWVPPSPKMALPVVALQVGAVLAAMAPVYLLGW